jgi:hypothetical protein
MSVPTHGPWCTTKTYKMICRECSAPVFFFSCNCGSRVLFDHPGHPWPEHWCWVTKVKEQIEGGAKPPDARYNVLLSMRRAGQDIPNALTDEWEALAKIEASLKKSPKRTLYREVIPDEARDFPGLVMSINKDINMTKRFKQPPNNEIARQLLGKLGRGRWHLLHLRERGADGLGVVAEMFCYMSAADMSRSGVKIGQRVLVSVIPYAPPHMEPVWIVTEVSTIR